MMPAPAPVPERPLSPIYAATTNIQPMVTIYHRYSIKKIYIDKKLCIPESFKTKFHISFLTIE